MYMNIIYTCNVEIPLFHFSLSLADYQIDQHVFFPSNEFLSYPHIYIMRIGVCICVV